MKKSPWSYVITPLAIGCIALGPAISSASEISTPAVPTAGFGVPEDDPLRYVAEYSCAVTNLSQKPQEVLIKFLNERGEVLPSPDDLYGFDCDPVAGNAVTIQPQETYPGRCSVTEYYGSGVFFTQKAVRCSISEFSGNTANWQVSLCAHAPLTVSFEEAAVCVQGP